MIKLKTLIIEDEEPARALIRSYVEDHQEIEIIGEFADGFSGLKAINELEPDLVFLDVQMPKLTGFELLELLEHRPVIIFTTAYDQYAIKAFEMNAADYLLKPFSRDRFGQAIQKVLKKFKQGETSNTELQAIVKSREEIQEALERIAVRSGKKIHVIPVSDIHFIEANGDYVMIHTDGQRFLKEKTMKYFEDHLDPDQFVRIHRSYIVNVIMISKIELYDKETHLVLLKDGNKLKASRKGYKILRDLLKL